MKDFLKLCRSNRSYIKLTARFDDLSSFWRFSAPKIWYWRFDDLCPYFGDFFKCKIYTKIFTPVHYITRSYFEVICEHLWWFFCILCVSFILLKPKNYNLWTNFVRIVLCDHIWMYSQWKMSVMQEYMIPGNKFTHFVQAESFVPIEQWKTAYVATMLQWYMRSS